MSKKILPLAPAPQLCAMPFTQLALRSNGNIIPCCLREDYVIGNIKDNSLKEIWNSEKIKALRREFLSGNVKTCKSDIEHHRCSRWTEFLIERAELAEHINSSPI